MPAPTQDDIDYLRDHPEVADHFEAKFKIPAQQFLRGGNAPTENDIEYLKKNRTPEVMAGFEKQFGDPKPYLKPTSFMDVQRGIDKDLSLPERVSPFRTAARVGATALDIGGELFSPSNWLSTAKGVGDVWSRLPDVVSKPENLKEMARGGIQGILSAPGMVSDLALAGMDEGGQLLAGNQPLVDYNPDAYKENPLGMAHTARMLEDWGNDVTEAAGAGKVFDFNEPATDEGKTARRLGEFAGMGGLAGGVKAIVPSITGALGTEVAREVAPDSAGWQAAGGLVGAHVPLGVRAVRGGIQGAASSVAPVMRQFTAGGREGVVGNTLRDAAGEGFDTSAPLPDNPLAAYNAAVSQNAQPGQPPPRTFQPTLGQQTNNRGTLALEKSQAMGAPNIAREFADRQASNQSVTHDVLEMLRGSGNPEEMRVVADRAAQIAQSETAGAEASATTGRTQSQAGVAARKLIGDARQKTRETRQQLWNDPAIKDVPIDVDPLRMNLAEYFQKQGPAYDGIMPEDVQATLRRMGETTTLKDLQDVRSKLGNYARDSAGKNDSNMARVYGDLRDIVGKYIDGQEFPDNPGAQAAYGKARAYSLFENQVFRQPDEMRAVLGKNPFGGEKVSAAETLQKFLKPGAAGLDTVRQLLRADNSANMHNAIGDHLYDVMMSKGTKARDGGNFLKQYADVLNEVPLVKGRLQQIVAKRAASEALERSPMNKFIGQEPARAVDQLFKHTDRIRAVRQLRAQVLRADKSGKAWEGMKAATVDKIMRTIEAAIEKDASGNPTIKPGVMNKFFRENEDILHEILGPKSANLVGSVADAVEMMTRTERSGKVYGSPTAGALAGERFIDHALLKYLDSPAGPIGSGASIGGAGLYAGGPVVGAAGFALGVAGHLAFSSARAEVAALLARALLNPDEGLALMRPATRANMAATPHAMRPYLEPYVMGARAGGAAAPQSNSPRRNEARPSPKALRKGDTVQGVVGGKKVTYTYRSGDPLESSSWETRDAQ